MHFTHANMQINTTEHQNFKKTGEKIHLKMYESKLNAILKRQCKDKNNMSSTLAKSKQHKHE